MTSIEDLRYTSEHEWVDARDGVATIGITAYAADRLGDVVYVSLPEVGDTVEAGTVIGEIESTKSVGELFAPMSGTVTAVNEALADSPETVNADAFGEGWLLKIQYTELPELLGAAEYQELTRA
ncbi:glycine cleavage system protein GcvH [Naasia sp. SYSU D00948]|uniref:glycine cleavage system protein GcvH n=1 Tax=Naasia sp. SYSU D00948 TaxID=2817379 RepID=UPI001B30F3CC|nr:glycine cleavage system protein GcvH [Naasia sp. SYSU D00948]